MSVRRWSYFFALFPRRYIERGRDWRWFDFENWSRNEYEWELDDWWGLKDIAQHPDETISTGQGDCVDYSVVALSYLYQTTDNALSLVLCYTKPISRYSHMIVYDHDEKLVYSSGNIHEMSLEEYKELSKYDRFVERTVR